MTNLASKSPTNLPPYNKNDILCHCMSIKRYEIEPIVQNKPEGIGLNELIDCTGAGSLCMSCHPLLEEITGETIWTPVNIISVTSLSKDASAFRFESKGNLFKSAKAGQHIVLQVFIQGVWETRRYTLTTAELETTYREIIVQKQVNGKVSNFLHDLEGLKIHIRISQPVGDVTPDLTINKPLVCLVGGVGVTPVIAFIRTTSFDSDKNREIILDHSVINKGRLILKQELDKLSKVNHNLHINYRKTDKTGFINQVNINDLVKNNPNSEYFICGPQYYTNAVLGYLENAGIGKKSISIEYFSSPQIKIIEQSKTYFFLGIFLFAAFILQDFFQLKLSWLENLQSQTLYKIYSGLFVAFYLLTQFILPYNKSCETAHAAADTYYQHKLRGALAPLVFFIHSSQFGTAYLWMLSIVYFGNIFLGLFNHERINNPIIRVQYFKIWLPIHICLSLMLMALVLFHIYVVVSY